jgi:hypothetical protein
MNGSNYIKKRFATALLVLLTALCGAVADAHSQEDPTGGVPGDWLSRYAGARSVGMGGAFVASMDGPIGALWNPAGLSLLSQNQVSFETSRLFESTSMHAFGFAMPSQRLPSFGLSIFNLRSGDFERTDELNQSLGTFGESDMAFLLSASKNMTRRLALGATAKVVKQSVDEFDAVAFGADLGVLFDVSPRVRVGASVLNLGGPSLTFRDSDETFPVELRAGVAIRFLQGKGLVSAEIDHRSGPGATLRAGGEFRIARAMALRLGYDDTSPTGGFSVELNPSLRFDYGATSHELGVTHRVGVSYRFGGFFASSKAVPKVFSPIGSQSVTKIHLKARTKAEVTSWSLEIVDKSGRVVRRFGGKGRPPAHVMWDGKDLAGMLLADGVYKYQLFVEDAEGRSIAGKEHKVEITTEGPRGSVPVIIE